jgi:hypothetical protein
MTFKGVFASLLVVAVVTMVATIDRFAPPPPPTTDEATTPGTPVAGRWTCPMISDLPATRATVTAAQPAYEGQSQVSLGVLRDGSRRAVSGGALGSAGALRAEVGGVAVIDWAGSPAGAYQEWWFEGGDLPPGIATGPCVHEVSSRWIIPGLTTSGGAEARLRITNPFRSDATIAVGFATPEGAAEPLALQNQSVPALGTLELVVNEYLPERDDLAAIVTVGSGRVVTAGLQLVRSAIGGIDGVSLLQAAPEPAEAWTVPWVVDGPDRSSWLWVVNPDPRVAAVEFTYHTPDGGVVADGLDEVLVEPGTMRRIDLRGTFPDGVEVAAVTARVSGARIVVSGVVEIDDPEPGRTGMPVQLGATAADTTWIVGGSASAERDEQLRVVNPGSSATSVSVAIRTALGVRRPAPLQEVVVPPGVAFAIDLTPYVTNAEHWTAFVLAEDPGVVAGVVGGSREGARRLVAWPGVASASWHPDEVARTAYMAWGLTQRLRTELGLRAPDPFTAAEPWVDPGDDVGPAPHPGPSSVVTPELPIVPGDIEPTPDDEADEDADDADGGE